MYSRKSGPDHPSRLADRKGLWLSAGLVLTCCAFYLVWLRFSADTLTAEDGAKTGLKAASAPVTTSTQRETPKSVSSALQSAANGEPHPFAVGPPALDLRKIVPFGRTLEFIGSVDPGSSLMIGDEVAEVQGDGTFKHFTREYPEEAQKVEIVLKVTDLAGRVRIVTAIHDFLGGSGKN